MKKTLILLLILLSIPVGVIAGGRKGLQPPPRQFEPNESADLRGKSELLFRWGSEGDRSVITEYQFKLYKGTQTVEAGLIKAETIPASIDHLSLPAELFENGQTYAWQLRGSGSGKTRPAYTIFKVEK